jgi:hypothetical protein
MPQLTFNVLAWLLVTFTLATSALALHVPAHYFIPTTIPATEGGASLPETHVRRLEPLKFKFKISFSFYVLY